MTEHKRAQNALTSICKPLFHQIVYFSQSSSFMGEGYTTGQLMGGKFLNLFTDGLAHNVGTSPKWTAAILQLHLELSLKDGAGEEFSQWTEFQAVYLIVHVVWRKKWHKFTISIESWNVEFELTGWLSDKKQQDWKSTDRKIWRSMCME